MVRRSPAAAIASKVATISDITPAVWNGTPFESRPGALMNSLRSPGCRR